MSVKIVQKSLPAGVVPYEEIADPVMKQKVMLLNRNIASLAAQVSELQRAAMELQNRPIPKQNEIADIERYVTEAQASADSAASSAISAGQSDTSARSAATSAGNSAASASASKTNAANSASDANDAKLAAEAARDKAVPAAQTAAQKADEAAASAEKAELAVRGALAGSVNYTNVNLGTAARETIYMDEIVRDASAQYDVKVTFVNESTTARSVSVNGVALSPALPGGVGKRVSKFLVVSGNGSFTVDNIATTVQVFIQAWRK